MKVKAAPELLGKKSFAKRLGRDLRMNGGLYLLFIPVALFFILFKYKPMGGLLIAFENYSPTTGMLGSDFVGLEHFKSFVSNPYFWRLMRNTITISGACLIFGSASLHVRG